MSAVITGTSGAAAASAHSLEPVSEIARPTFLAPSVAATLAPRPTLEPVRNRAPFQHRAEPPQPQSAPQLEPRPPAPPPLPKPEPQPLKPNPVIAPATFSASSIAAVAPSRPSPQASAPPKQQAGFYPRTSNIGPAVPQPTLPIPPSSPHPVARQSLSISPSERITPHEGVAPPPPAEKSKPGILWRGLRLIALVAAGWLAFIVALIFVYRFVNPPVSSLMIQHAVSGQSVTQSWADINEISPQLVRAVIVSEDGRFCDHYGIDYDAIQQAIERSGDGTPRGASTISMQVVKNLFLWPSKSYLRKALEVPLTYLMEFVWPKQRIMEVYLNIAEWGPGVFGAEAAAHYHFDKSSRRLSDREAARLAVALPNPISRVAGNPGPGTRKLAAMIQARMRAAPASQTACVLPRRKS